MPHSHLLLLPPPPPPPPHIMCPTAGTAPHGGPAQLPALYSLIKKMQISNMPVQQLEAAQQQHADLCKNISGKAVT
eukprot:1148997-Pelagomonas_calceolata.AAC.4